MPLYEYKCDFCFNEEVRLRKITDRFNSLPCPSCGNNMTMCYSKFSTLNGPMHEVAGEFYTNTKESQVHESKGIQIHGNRFINVDIGISLPRGVRAEMSGNTFDNVKTPLQIRNR